MSLETQVAAVVTATNTLTTEVSNKLASIDAAIANMQANIGSVMSLNLFVDAIAGNDANDGSESSPLQTIAAAALRVPNGGNLHLLAKEGQVHEVSDVILNNINFSLDRWGNSSTTPQLKAVPYNGEDQNIGRGFACHNATVRVSSFAMEGLLDSERPNVGEVWSPRSGLFSSERETGASSFFFFGCITKKTDIPIVRMGAGGQQEIYIQDGSFVDDGGASSLFYISLGPYSEAGVTRYPGMVDTDIIPHAGSNTLLSNVPSMNFME